MILSPTLVRQCAAQCAERTADGARCIGVTTQHNNKNVKWVLSACVDNDFRTAATAAGEMIRRQKAAIVKLTTQVVLRTDKTPSDYCDCNTIN